MTKRMLINATQPEQLRVALVEKQWLFDLDIETQSGDLKKSNIYKCKVSRLEPSLEAAFVEYGGNRQGFLPFREIAHHYFRTHAPSGSDKKLSIKDVLAVGDQLIVQVEKDERGNKGAALTTFISLAGCYLVLMPNNPKVGGISRRIDDIQRAEIRDNINQLSIPDGMGLIVRTAGMGRNIEELEWDLQVLLSQWQAIQDAANKSNASFLIFQESNVILRAIRDHLKPDIEEIIIDHPEVYKQACKHIRMVKPDFESKVRLYNDSVPLFTNFEIENQIESAFKREIRLPSGGSVVFDHAEALVAIDINSSKATKGEDIEQTALNTNLEAAHEISRQMRLRDLGGLIVIDFIDMTSAKNQRLVENSLHQDLAIDRARVQIGRISRFGLLEMSRQRLRSALTESHGKTCPRCQGQGIIYSVETLTLLILREIEELAMKDSSDIIRLELPVDAATFLINEKRDSLLLIEKRHHVRIIVLPNPHIQTPKYQIENIKVKQDQISLNSHQVIQTPQLNYETLIHTAKNKDLPAVQLASLPQAPMHVEKNKAGLFKKFFKRIIGSQEEIMDKNKKDSKCYKKKSNYQHKLNRRHHQHHNQRYHSEDNNAILSHTKNEVSDNTLIKQHHESKRHRNNKNRHNRNYNQKN